MKCPRCKESTALQPTNWKERTEPPPDLLECTRCGSKGRYYVWARDGIPGLNKIALIVKAKKYEELRNRHGANTLAFLIEERNRAFECRTTSRPTKQPVR